VGDQIAWFALTGLSQMTGLNSMATGFQILPITGVDARLAPLSEEAARDGFRFIERLTRDWASGSNTFSRPGERLIAAIRGSQIIGVCGLNRDPYTGESGVGRLRHLYVMKSEREQGAGRALVRLLLEEARATFVIVRLRTDTLQAARFYERLGFVKTEEENATHVARL
jgi:GNAT superfamily N-acetyltransferase